MKALFWLVFLGLFVFEIANVYFILPMPGSQQMNSIDLAYFLYRCRWAFQGSLEKKMVIDSTGRYTISIGLYGQF